MPRAEIASKQAVLYPRTPARRIGGRQPGFNAATIAADRRNQSDPWFKRGCDNVLEVFNGNKLIAYRLTIQPSIKHK